MQGSWGRATWRAGRGARLGLAALLATMTVGCGIVELGVEDPDPDPDGLDPVEEGVEDAGLDEPANGDS